MKTTTFFRNLYQESDEKPGQLQATHCYPKATKPI